MGEAAARRRLVRFSIFIAIVASVLAAWAFWWEPRRLVFRETSLSLSCWTGRPIRIALLADLHVGSPYTGVDKLARLVRLTNERRPDLILLLGDFVIQGVVGGTFVPPERIATSLRGLRAPLGVYAVLGNHDRWLDGPRIERAFIAAGIPVVEDRAIHVQKHDVDFWLVGVSDYITAPHDVRGAMAQVSGERPVLVMTHNPDVFPLIPRRVCLTLAGHTHGGQVAFPIIGRPIVPSLYGQDYAIGHVHDEQRDLFVSAGVGTSIFPVRFRVPPEVVILTVQAPN